MPAVVAAASMEYCGLSVKPGSLLDMHREVEQRLRDLRGLGDQLVEGSERDEVRPRVCAFVRAFGANFGETRGHPAQSPSWCGE